MAKPQAEEVDFKIVCEDWTKYSLTDGTLLRVRIGVLKIVKEGIGELGLPNFGVATNNLVSVICAKDLLRTKADAVTTPITPQEIKDGIDIDYQPVEAGKWQEYQTVDGYTVLLRPELGKVVRLRRYAPIGTSGLWEPVYWANIQQVHRLKKTT